MKEFFRQTFSNQPEIRFWEDIYGRLDFLGMCFRERMNTALAWIDGLNIPKSSVILDAGCGAGILLNEISKRGYRIFGMDYSFGMLKNVKGNGDGGGVKELPSFIQSDVEFLPFKDSSVNLVVCLGVVAYLESLPNALHELSRILDNNGTLILSIVNKARLINRLDLPLIIKKRLQNQLGGKIPFIKKNDEIKHNVSRKAFFISKFIKLLKEYDFTVLEYKTVPLGLLTLFGKELPPKKLNMAITMLFEKPRDIPIIESLGGMCIFKLQKQIMPHVPNMNPNSPGLTSFEGAMS